MMYYSLFLYLFTHCLLEDINYLVRFFDHVQASLLLLLLLVSVR